MNKTSNNNESATDVYTLLADAVFRPILFSTPMVQSILDGRKTQTRRIIKGQPFNALSDIICQIDDFKKGYYGAKFKYFGEERYEITNMFKPSYQVEDILWVRETFRKIVSEAIPVDYMYKADVEKQGWNFKWKPSIFMPKKACRIFLKVMDIRVERLQDISEKDAIAEGVEEIAKTTTTMQSIYENYMPDDILGFAAAENSFKSLWESINGKGSWNKNPWVWVYEFERIERPLGFC